MDEICICDVSELSIYLNKNLHLFDIWTLRQQIYKEHNTTTSIPFLWLDEPYHPVFKDKIIEFTVDTTLNKLVDNAINVLKNTISGYPVRAMIVNMKPNTKIPEHVDYGIVLSKTKRFHLPIQTNDDVTFFVNMIPYHLTTGIWYEINNKVLHSVENNSNFNRVHLIVDIYAGEQIV